MSKIEIGRYSSWLRRTLGMKGATAVAEELSPEISPVLELESALNEEWDFLKGVKQISTAEEVSANAAGAGQLRIRNPVASGVLATITHVEGVAVINGEWTARLQPLTTDLTNTAVTVARDGRWNPVASLSQSAMRVTFEALTTIGVGSGTIYHHRGLLSRTPVVLGAQVILPPGFALSFGFRAANNTVTIQANWHERGVPALELE